MAHYLGQKKIRKISLQINSSNSVKWFYMTVEIKLGLQYKPENLDVNKSVLLSNWMP